MRNQLLFSVTETSQVGEARRKTSELAKGLGFDDAEVERVAIVVTELATNLVKHAGGGSLLVRVIKQNGQTGQSETPGIELLALDKGRGMANVAECLRDGYSTVGSQGQGLGAINRLATYSEIYSQPGAGTVHLTQLWGRQTPPAHTGTQFEVGGVCLPKRGEIVSGDAWGVIQHPERCLVVVADGLGHGSAAAVAAGEAIKVLESNSSLEPARLLEFVHLALRPTRGAAVAVAEITASSTGRQVKFAGIGNISGSVITAGEVRHMVSHNGIAGHEARKFQEFTYPWSRGSLLVLHSDGLNTRWRLESYPGLTVRHSSLIAGVLYRDFDRKTDDVTAVVVKER
jgi:anti-sigma regulatory factor (Ser/Thr protein kinase)